MSRLTLDEKVLLVTGRDFWSLQPTRSIGLRSVAVSDGATALASTWGLAQEAVITAP